MGILSGRKKSPEELQLEADIVASNNILKLTRQKNKLDEKIQYNVELHRARTEVEIPLRAHTDASKLNDPEAKKGSGRLAKLGKAMQAGSSVYQMPKFSSMAPPKPKKPQEVTS